MTTRTAETTRREGTTAQAAPTVRIVSPLGVSVLGSGIIAITYGLARFVFGLFLPEIRADMGFGATLAGVIGALPFASFILALAVAPALADRVGARQSAALATALALTGLVAIALAPGPLVLAAGVAVCGLSTGLSSPVMAHAVQVAVRPTLRGRVNATINAGTSLGVALALPVLLWGQDAWRQAYLVFAVLAALGVVAAIAGLPGRAASAAVVPPSVGLTQRAGPDGRTEPVAPAGIDRWRRRSILRVAALAGAMGFVSAIFWVFAPDLTVHAGGLKDGQGGWMWLAVGLGGLVGATAGDLIDRFGAAPTHAAALAILAGAVGALALAPDTLASALVASALFGAAYMTLSGFYLVRGTRILANRPSLGPVLPLMATASGQVLGSPVGGWLIDAAGHATAFWLFAAVGLTVAAASLRLARPVETD